MGKSLFDIYSMHHFLSGLFGYLILKLHNVSLAYNFIFANSIHLIIELCEHNVTPTGKVIETTRNHIGDIISFAFGWYIGFCSGIKPKYNTLFALFLYCFVIYALWNEFGREFYPYNTTNPWLPTGAFVDK